MDSSSPSWFDRLIAPRALLLGVVVSFVACCLAGYLTTRHNYLHQFKRFHALLGPESLFYPTACQVRALARNQLHPDKIIVIVGGSSILHGTCQPATQVWTDRLQNLLGERFQVLNLALRSGRPTELGAIVAEFLERDFKKVLLITDVLPGSMPGDPDGLLFRYFFWDAYYQGLLLPDEARAERLQAGIAEAEQVEQCLGAAALKKMGMMLAEARRELQREMALNRGFYFCDLWTTLAYTRCHTLWTPLTRSAFTRPRKSYQDPDPGGPPLAVRYAFHYEQEITRIRAQIATPCLQQDANQEWVLDPTSETWPLLDRAARTSFPEPTRKRTLILMPWYSPYYLHRLTAVEQARYAALSRCTVHRLQELGFASLAIGEGYKPADYSDLVHLMASGGEKMAAAVAPQIRALAERLGYLKEGVER